jgi:stage II sporulation protein AA (anti-sigma F factor antagonist)
MLDGIRRFLRAIREAPVPVPCEVEPLDSEHGFRLSGELDIYRAQAVREALESELHGTLVLDMAGVTFIDESGLALLISTVKRLHRQGGSLVLRNPSDQIMRVLEMTGLAKLPGLDLRRTAGSSPPR